MQDAKRTPLVKRDSADLLSGNAHRDRSTRLTLAVWPRLLDLHLAAAYCSVGKRTIEDWIHDELLRPTPMPGSILRDKAGNVIAHAKDRRIAKILIAREDLDRLIDERRGLA
jgi:hypothetical protein